MSWNFTDSVFRLRLRKFLLIPYICFFRFLRWFFESVIYFGFILIIVILYDVRQVVLRPLLDLFFGVK